MLFRVLTTTAALLGGISVAQSADLPARAPAVVAPVAYNWTGFYIGANGGYGWSAFNVSSGSLSADIGDLKGPFAGGQIGYNYQVGQFVFGLEVDGQWADIKQSFPGVTIAIEYFLTARGRLGVAFDNVLLYGTGGYMHAGANTEVTNGLTTVSTSGANGGWTAGAGAEIGFGNASVKLEYLYLQSFDEDLGFGVSGNVHAHTVKLGLNYRFGGSSAPIAARY
jgi:outer membrane immunogenic protein